jgi:hypothetical protein
VEMFWKYQDGDWVAELGLPDHHLRIISRYVSVQGQRCYLIFDTTRKRAWADYEARLADELEKNSHLVQHAASEEHARSILQLCANARFLPYSIPERQDCESLQRWIHTGGREEYRWSPQVWGGIAIVAFALVQAVIQTQPRSRPRRRKVR